MPLAMPLGVGRLHARVSSIAHATSRGLTRRSRCGILLWNCPLFDPGTTTRIDKMVGCCNLEMVVALPSPAGACRLYLLCSTTPKRCPMMTMLLRVTRIVAGLAIVLMLADRPIASPLSAEGQGSYCVNGGTDSCMENSDPVKINPNSHCTKVSSCATCHVASATCWSSPGFYES
jgi:hypothetical protein